ncbi:MAG TPA: TonB-dependent receptor [Acidobacteriota bacterium]|nr:TonB-dependent receptor [Acidobacteriota bacterium]
MKNKFHPLLTLSFFLITIPVSAQVATNTGSIYGKVLNEKEAPLSEVTIQLESDTIPPQSATTGPNGAFRFANLPPGNYAATFSLPGFTEVRQEGLRITVGLNIELKTVLKAGPKEELTVIGETPLLDTQKTGNEYSYSREYLDQIPGGRDPWFVIEQTPGIDSDRYNVAGSESGNQSAYYARGGADQNIWNYDGVNITGFGGAPYLDFDSLEEIEIVTGGSDASIQTGAVMVNLVTKRGGNQWHANASYYFVDDYFQSDNTPEELIEKPIINPLTGEPARGSNRTHKINEYGFDIGGPVLKDRLFIWGAYRRNQIEQFSIQDVPDNTRLLDYTFKASFNFNSEHESQFGYLWSDKSKQGRELFPGEHAVEALWDQEGNLGTTPLEGIWTATHTWIPNDHTILTGRYAWFSLSWGLIPRGGKDVPMIYLAAIPHWEDTFYYYSPIENTAHDVNIDANYFKENWIGGDHEFKYGFVYQQSSAHSFSSYGNGVMMVDYYQTVPRGPLTSGYLKAELDIDGRYSESRYGFYASDTFRKDRWTFNLGVRFDHQTAKNQPSNIRAVPGFEQFVGPIEYPGGDPGVAFNNISPRAGVTYELRDKMILRGNFARYYDAFDPSITVFSNPTYGYKGAQLYYVNRNGDRTITPDELVSDPIYYGGLTGAEFDLDAYLAKRKYDPDLSNTWTNEVIAGIESELLKDLSVSVTYTYRRYGDILSGVPFGISAADYVLADEPLHVDTPIGSFDVPYYILPFKHDGTGIFQNVDNFRRSYQGLDLAVRKRMSKNFLLSGSLTLQKQKAHYNGEGSLAFVPFILFPGTTFAFDPTNLPFLDNQTYAFSGRFGIRPFSEWYLKISGYYQLPWEIGVGAFLRYQQGYPYVISGTVADPSLLDFYQTSIHRFFVEPFGSRRLDNKFTLDLRVEKGIEMGRYGRFTAIVDLFNVTNENAVLRRNQNLRAANFYQIQEVISPRTLRFGLRFSY